MTNKTKSTATAQGRLVRWSALLTLALFTIASAALVAKAQDKTIAPKAAQEQKLTTTTVADNKYGEGGTLETTSDEKLKVVKEVWKDKNGHVREAHTMPDSGSKWEVWTFEGGARTVRFEYVPDTKELDIYMSGKGSGTWKDMNRAEFLEWAQKVGEQYAKDGSVSEPWNKKEASNESDTNQPKKTKTESKPAPNSNPQEAQTHKDWYPVKWEALAAFQYQRAPDEPVKNLYGFNASLFYNVTPHVSVGGDFSFLFGSTSETVGTVKFDTSLHRQTYLFGPQFNFYPDDKVKVFVHPLFGGVHDTVKFTFGTSTTDSSANAFAMAFGGGVDVRVTPRVSFRVFQADYQPTHFGGEWQNNFRLSTGLVLRLGGK